MRKSYLIKHAEQALAEYESLIRTRIAKEIEQKIIENDNYEHNQERIGGLEIALDIVWGKSNG